MNSVNDCKLQQIPFPLEKVRVTVLQFLICNVILLIFGIAELVTTLFLKESKTEYFIYIIDDVNDNCSYLIKGACICSIILAMVALLTHMLGYPGRLLCSLPYLLVCSFALMTVGVGEAASTHVSNEQMYKRVMEVDKHYYQNRDSLFPISQDKTLTTDFQNMFSCCGMFSIKDWYLSDCNCMPLSCIKQDKVTVVKPLFMKDNSLNKLDAEMYHKLQPYVWNINCLPEIQKTTAKLKKKWLIIIGVSAAVHFLLATWYFHIATILIDLLLSPVGHVQLQIFRAHWPTKRIKVKPEYRRFARVDDVYSGDDSNTSENEIYEDKGGGIPRMTISLVSTTSSRALPTENIHDGNEVKVRFVRDRKMSTQVQHDH